MYKNMYMYFLSVLNLSVQGFLSTCFRLPHNLSQFFFWKGMASQEFFLLVLLSSYLSQPVSQVVSEFCLNRKAYNLFSVQTNSKVDKLCQLCYSNFLVHIDFYFFNITTGISINEIISLHIGVIKYKTEMFDFTNCLFSHLWLVEHNSLL